MPQRCRFCDMQEECDVYDVCKVISICNQKGGVGKTTTAASLGVALAMKDERVLLIDLDPQSDLSACLGVERTDELDVTVSTMMGKAANEELFDPMRGNTENRGRCIFPAVQSGAFRHGDESGQCHEP